MLLDMIKKRIPYSVRKYLWKVKRILYGKEYLSYYTFADMSLAIKNSLPSLPADIDLIVGIPRSGMIPAYMIALFLNKPCCSISEFINGISPEHGHREISTYREDACKKVLIVDDSSYSGRSFQEAKEKLSAIASAYTFIYYSVFATERAKNTIDLYSTITTIPRIFQWNYLNHNILSKCCVDIDGVLCVDPTEEENDDGEKYKQFLLTAKPLYIPKVKIYALVTSRLEKYRLETEKWLADHGVHYEYLIMLDLPNAEERRRRGCHAAFKASVYQNYPETILFLESNDIQARLIATIAHKPCICVTTDSFYR